MKLILLVITLSCFIGLQAQIKVGVQAGYNNAHFTPKKSSSEIYSYSTSGFRGFHAGAVAEMRLWENWIFRLALLINGKGSRIEKTGLSNKSSRFIELHYIELPLIMVHKWNVGKNSSAFTGAGIYIARAFRGVEKGEGTSLSGPYYIYNTVKFNSQNKENQGHPTIINPFDYGLNFLAGVQRQNIQLSVGYGHGLQRVFPKSLAFKDKFTNSVFSLSATYLFKVKR